MGGAIGSWRNRIVVADRVTVRDQAMDHAPKGCRCARRAGSVPLRILFGGFTGTLR